MKWILVLLVVLCNTASDVLNTHGMKQHGEVRDFRPRGIRRLILAVAGNRSVVAGIALGAVAFVGLLLLLSIAPLSFAVPATAASYVLETALAKTVLRERITAKRWTGAFLVAGGVALLAFH